MHPSAREYPLHSPMALEHPLRSPMAQSLPERFRADRGRRSVVVPSSRCCKRSTSSSSAFCCSSHLAKLFSNGGVLGLHGRDFALQVAWPGSISRTFVVRSCLSEVATSLTSMPMPL